MGAFADFADLAHGPDAEWGQVSCGCHPNCGVGTAVMIDKETKDMAPVPAFLNIPGLVTDMQKITDAGRGKWKSNLMMGLALLKHYNSYNAPKHFSLYELFKKFDKSFGLTGRSYGRVDGKRSVEDIEARRSDRWNFLFIAGHVVPGLVQLRLPPHRDVHHPLRHAGGRDLFLRLQHGHRLAQHHRADAPERDRRASGTRSTGATKSSPRAKRCRWPRRRSASC